MWEDPLFDARGAGTPGHNGLYRARGVARLPVALEQKSRFTPFELAAYDHLRSQRIAPPAPERLRRLLGMTVRQREERFVKETLTQLSSQTRAALDALVKMQMPENDGDAEQGTLFPIRSDLAVIKQGAGALRIEIVLDEIAKLEQLRAIGLPEDLFGDVRAKLVTQYRQRAGTEWPQGSSARFRRVVHWTKRRVLAQHHSRQPPPRNATGNDVSFVLSALVALCSWNSNSA